MANPNPTPTPPPEQCQAEQTQTSARLETTAIDNGGSNVVLVYKVQVADCQTLDVVELGWDLMAEIIKPEDRPSNADYQASYIITEIGIEGQLVTVEGTDLFGNTGPTFFHTKTDQSFTIPENQKELTLEIRLPDGYFYENLAGELTFVADTYLKLGSLEPVTTEIQVWEGEEPVELPYSL